MDDSGRVTWLLLFTALWLHNILQCVLMVILPWGEREGEPSHFDLERIPGLACELLHWGLSRYGHTENGSCRHRYRRMQAHMMGGLPCHWSFCECEGRGLSIAPVCFRCHEQATMHECTWQIRPHRVNMVRWQIRLCNSCHCPCWNVKQENVQWSAFIFSVQTIRCPTVSLREAQYPVPRWYHLVARQESCRTGYESSERVKGRGWVRVDGSDVIA